MARRTKSSNWMAGAVKRPGALRAKAKRSGGMKGGKISQSWLRAHDKGNSRTAKQARLAETFRKAGRK